MHNALKSVFVAAAVVASVAASAQPYARHDDADIDVRRARQEQRIERGIASGELTRQEARALRHGQREIARVEARAKADGRITRFERRRLVALLDRADAQIRRLRHDEDRHHHPA